jgi:hypothetical protein
MPAKRYLFAAILCFALCVSAARSARRNDPHLRLPGRKATFKLNLDEVCDRALTGLMSIQHLQSPSTTLWRPALLALTIILSLTNLVELASTLRPGYWDHVGQIGLSGSDANDKLRLSARNIDLNQAVPLTAHDSNAAVPALQPGDLISVVSPRAGALGIAPSVREFERIRERSEPITLRIEHGQQSLIVDAVFGTPLSAAGLLTYYAQVFVDLIFGIVGGLLAWRKPDDKAIRALAIAMICWSSIIPNSSDSPVYDVLFWINEATARLWVTVMLVYWAINFPTATRWGISRLLQRLWPAWATLTVLLACAQQLAAYHAFPVDISTLRQWADNNQTVVFIASLAALAEGIVSTQGVARTRIRWALCVFGLYFSLFPYRIYVEPRLDALWPSELPTVVVDNALQLVLPLGLMYATLRHRLLDLSFAINRGLVYGAISVILLAAFFGLEKLSESVLRPEGREQNALLAGGIAFGIFLLFHKVRDWVERNVDRMFFSTWHHKENSLREYVRSASHITRIEALLDSCVAAVDRFTDHAGCALYRRDPDGNYQRLSGSAAGAAPNLDGNGPIVLAMRVARGPVACADIDVTWRADWALPIVYRGEIDGFMLLNRKLSQEAYRPDEIDVLGFAIQQIGLDLTALEREQYKQQASSLAAQASSARSSAEEMKALLQIALGRRDEGIGSPQ